MREPASQGTSQVRSLTRALTLLKHLAASADGMTLTELSDAASLPPSTTHRLLTTLEAERFVRPEPTGGIWRVGVAAFLVGSAFARSRDKLTISKPYLRRLMELSGETANLFIASDGEAICIGQIESRHAMRAITGVGGRIKLHASAAGKVLMAYRDRGERDQMLRASPLEQTTPTTIVDPDRLSAILDQVVADGFAIDDEEHSFGLRCVASPIFDESGAVIAAISVSGPTTRLPDDRLKSLGRMTSEVGLIASRDYGGPGPERAT